MNKAITVIFRYLFMTLRHPVTLISLLGPPFLVINVHWLQILLDSSVIPGSSELVTALKSPWTFAVSDFILQLYTLLLVIIVYYLDLAAHVIALLRRDLMSELTTPGWRFAFLGISTLVLVVFIVLTASGVFGQPAVAELYLPDSGRSWGELHMPPLNSPITWARSVMLLLGFWLPYWIQATKKSLEAGSQAPGKAV